MRRTKRKTKWKKNRIIVATILIIIVGALLVNLYISTTPYGKLRKLDYSREVIKLMADDVQTKLIEEAKYSETVSQALLEKRFVEKNLDIYLSINYKKNDSFIKYINKLAELEYNKDDIVKIYKNVAISDITKIIKEGYIKNITDYLNISYFRIDNLKRYVDYREKSEKQYADVIEYVNIGLDQEFYDEEYVTTTKEPTETLVLVNKYNKLPDKYEPKDLVKISKTCSKEESYLRKEAATAFEKLCQASIDEGYKVLALSAYRSYKTQDETWNEYMKAYGKSYTYYYVAKPGYSEHQTGLALDLASGSNLGQIFSYTKDYTWTINNAYKYGFILRYEEGNENITGYNFEPWHIRYVGTSVAKYIYDHEITFDEYIATN